MSIDSKDIKIELNDHEKSKTKSLQLFDLISPEEVDGLAEDKSADLSVPTRNIDKHHKSQSSGIQLFDLINVDELDGLAQDDE